MIRDTDSNYKKNKRTNYIGADAETRRMSLTPKILVQESHSVNSFAQTASQK